MTGFHIAWLRLTGPNVEPAEITFKSGLNVISGASNTGKSFILSCIDYMLGHNSQLNQINELRGYSTGWLAIYTHQNRKLILERSLRGGNYRVHEVLGENWHELKSTRLYKAAHTPGKNDTISYLLHSICGSNNSLVLANNRGKTHNLSFRNFAKYCIVDEVHIIDPSSPIYVSKQVHLEFEDRSHFSVYLSGTQLEGIIEVPELKETKANWRGKVELLDEMIARIEEELSELDVSQDSIEDEINILSSRISRLLTELENQQLDLAKAREIRDSAWKISQQNRSRLLVINQLLLRFDLLRRHYDSDLERLSFIREGEYLLSQLGSPHCPYCGGPIDDQNDHFSEHSTIDAEELHDIQQAALAESQKILADIKDLQSTIDILEEEREYRSTTIGEQEAILATQERLIQRELAPRVTVHQGTMTQLIEERARLLSLNLQFGQLNYYKSHRESLGPEPRKQQFETIDTIFNDADLRDFLTGYASVLKSWNFPNARIADLNQEDDIVVDGKARKLHGKGFRALLQAAFTISLMRYGNRPKSRPELHHPSFVVIDSPLTSYKESDQYDTSEDIQKGFFEDLSKLDKRFQVIVLENKDPSDKLPGSINHIHFSKVEGQGRYGFIPLRST